MDNTRQLERYQDSSQISQCVDCTPLVPATLGLPRTGVSVLSPSTLLRLPAALYGAGPALSAVPVFGSSIKVRIQLRLRFVPSPASAVQAARGLGALSPDAARLRTALKHVYYLGWNRSPAQVGCMRQVLGPDALGRPRGIGWRGRWKEG